ncbi:MAG: hypothetical protein JO149_09720 [Gammaproteobacteria bacterium]|nr:hypothetical protein [Gammaproteobacteria bacterium]
MTTENEKNRSTMSHTPATKKSGEQSHSGSGSHSGGGRGSNLTQEDRRRGGEHSHSGKGGLKERESGQGSEKSSKIDQGNK